jgi:hypothetical protein
MQSVSKLSAKMDALKKKSILKPELIRGGTLNDCHPNPEDRVIIIIEDDDPTWY